MSIILDKVLASDIITVAAEKSYISALTAKYPERKEEKSMEVEVKLSPNELLTCFGERIFYTEVEKLLPMYSELEQKKIREGVRRKQQEIWNELSDYYDVIHPQLPPISSHFENLLEAINPQKGETILDLGCGAGALINRLLVKEPDLKVIGIDYSPQMLKRAERNLSDSNDKVILIETDLSNGLPLKDKVDKCISNWGIAYSSRDTLEGVILPEIHRVLKPQGVFVCAMMIVGGDKLKKLGRFLSLPAYLRKRQIINQAKQFGGKLERFFPTYTVEQWKEMLENNFVIEKGFFSIYGTSFTAVTHPVG